MADTTGVGSERQLNTSPPDEAANTAYSAIWQPLTIGNTEVRNRIVDPAKTVLYADDHIIGDRHIWFYRERAKGGAGLIITEQQGAHPIGKGSFHKGCTAWEKRAIPQFERLAHAVHDFGAKLFVQLYTPGVHDKGTMIVDEWHPLWGASRVPSIIHHEVPMVMEQEHIDSLVREYGESALNVFVSGLDGVEIHGAHSYQIGQFLSPYYNLRTDRYGGDPKRRCQLAIEIGEEVRRRVPDDFTMGLRMSFDEFLGDAGITPDQAEEQLDHLASSGLFDYFSISGGAYPTLHMTVGSMRIPKGHLIPLAKRAKAVVGDRAAIFTVGRITDLAMAEQAVADGSTDMVAMSRALLADPFLVKKAQEGREAETIKCIGINECLGRLFDQREVICALNPATGREKHWGDGTLDTVSPPDVKRIVVVGGGPAGMKVASVAASRGHDVVLLERDHDLGGHIRLIKELPTRDEWEGAIDNLVRAMDTAGVDVQLGSEATTEVLDALSPDVVICATGSYWDASGFSSALPNREKMSGADQDNVIDIGTACGLAVEDVSSLGEKVLIYDETGTYLPLALAELLSEAGVSVEIATVNFFVGEDALRTFELQHVMPVLQGRGVKFSAQEVLGAVDGATAQLIDIWAGEARAIEDLSTVVLATSRIPEDGLYQSIRDRYPAVHRIGDSVAPRKIQAVIFEGEEMGRSI